MDTNHPGVYIIEEPSQVRPIAGVSTSTALFLGAAERGPINEARPVLDERDFASFYGGGVPNSYLADAVGHFFANGGARCYVLRVARSPKTASVKIDDREDTARPCLTVAAANDGDWGNDLRVEIKDTEARRNVLGDAFDLIVYEGGEVRETYEGLTVDQARVSWVERQVTGRSARITVTVESDIKDDTQYAGTSESAENPASSLEKGTWRLLVDVDHDGPQAVDIKVADELSDTDAICAEIQRLIRDLSRNRSTTNANAYKSFTASYADDKYVLTSGSKGPQSSVQVTSPPKGDWSDAAEKLSLGLAHEGTETSGAALLRPANGTYQLDKGDDGETPGNADIVDALKAGVVDAITDINLVATPGYGDSQVLEAGIGFCGRRKDCFFIGDSLQGENAEQVAARVPDLGGDRSYGSVYFPWVLVADADVSGALKPVPPSGFVAGTFARIDASRGVWKAPAGTDASLSGALGVQTSITDGQQDALNPKGINVIRSFPGVGRVIWGSRSLAVDGNPYGYVPVRRTAIYIEQSIYQGIRWAVFEPNDESLWGSLRLNIGSFMTGLFRVGAFQGRTASEAFFVQCDAKTNPQDQIDLGRVTVLVGFAPLKPAEFVIVRISQKTQSATT